MKQDSDSNARFFTPSDPTPLSFHGKVNNDRTHPKHHNEAEDRGRDTRESRMQGLLVAKAGALGAYVRGDLALERMTRPRENTTALTEPISMSLW